MIAANEKNAFIDNLQPDDKNIFFFPFTQSPFTQSPFTQSQIPFYTIAFYTHSFTQNFISQ